MKKDSNEKAKQIDSLKKKLKAKQKEINKLKEQNKRLKQIQKNNNELKYAFVFNDTIKESSWLKRKDFSLVNSAANYSLMYSLYRILNDAQPKNILELGLGQTSKATTQYANHFKDAKLTIVEGDQDWIDIFSQNLEISDNVEIVQLDVGEFEYDNTTTYRFKDFLDVAGSEKYDLIIIDGPQGFIDTDEGRQLLHYSRTNVWQLIPDNIADEFIILMDDCERKGETRTFNHVKELMEKNNIEFYEYKCSGLKTQRAILSEKFRYISWI